MSAASGRPCSTAVRIVLRRSLRDESKPGVLSGLSAVVASHFFPLPARPIAFAIVDVEGHAKGTTKTLERELDETLGSLGDSTRRAWVEEAGMSSIRMPSLGWDKVEGMGSVCEVRRTEYCISHRSKTSSGDFADIAASSTCDEVRERREISSDVRSEGGEAMKEN